MCMRMIHFAASAATKRVVNDYSGDAAIGQLPVLGDKLIVHQPHIVKAARAYDDTNLYFKSD